MAGMFFVLSVDKRYPFSPISPHHGPFCAASQRFFHPNQCDFWRWVAERVMWLRPVQWAVGGDCIQIFECFLDLLSFHIHESILLRENLINLGQEDTPLVTLSPRSG